MHSKRLLPIVAFVVACPFGALPLGHAEGVYEDIYHLVRPLPKTPPLEAYKGTNRVLLVFAPSAEDPAYVEQLALWKKDRQNFEERQLVIRPVLKGQSSTKELTKMFSIEKNSFAVVLIGKDGNEAYRADAPVKPGALYSRIDAMPMRREEMKRQRRAAHE